MKLASKLDELDWDEDDDWLELEDSELLLLLSDEEED